jgi:hypothetical protein
MCFGSGCGDLLLFGFHNNMNIEETLLYLKNGYTNLKIQSHKNIK